MSTEELAPTMIEPPVPRPRPADGNGPPVSIRAERRFPQRLALNLQRLVLAVVAMAVLFAAVDVFGGEVVYTQRQHQRSADFKTPRPNTLAGRAIGVLQIPRLGLNLTIAEGVTAATLRGGPGHLASSAVPGASGNAVIFGHRSHFGGPFGKIGLLKPGDTIYVQPKGTSEVVAYTVSSVDRGGRDKLALLAPSDRPELTLVTSAGGWLTTRRLIVRAQADAPVQRPPAAIGAPRAPDGFDQNGGLVSWNLALAVVFLALGIITAATLRRGYPRLVVAVASAAPVALALVFIWFEIDRWLPSTL
jgi:sortase A